MPQWSVLSRQNHAQQHFRPRQGCLHAAEQIITPVLHAELHKLVSQCVLGFVSTGDSYQLVALLGVEQGKNLYINHDGRWLGSYVPANVRAYPFALSPAPDGQKVLCIDAEQLTQAPEGVALFDEQEQPSETVVKQLEFLQQCDTDRQRTQAAVDALQQANVLQPWPLELQGSDGEPIRMGGFYRVDEARLNALNAEQYARLQGPAMAIVHAHFFSCSQLHQLTERLKHHSRQEQLSQSKTEVEQQASQNLDALFGSQDDTLKFDF